MGLADTFFVVDNKLLYKQQQVVLALVLVRKQVVYRPRKGLL